jgi:hypothetical protein
VSVQEEVQLLETAGFKGKNKCALTGPLFSVAPLLRRVQRPALRGFQWEVRVEEKSFCLREVEDVE